MRADLHKLIDEPSILHCFSKEEALTPDEKAKFTSWLAAAMRQREYEWSQYRNGVIDRATWTEPHQYPEGIPFVLVNGLVVIDESNRTGEFPGKVLHGAASEQTISEK
ncbi:hypothetical protein IH799_08960 [candidate division KSB1 bacterium]|nr:hypothetical protein [candidate division KSB1 bacterium]